MSSTVITYNIVVLNDIVLSLSLFFLHMDTIIKLDLEYKYHMQDKNE